MVPIAGRPLLDYWIELLAASPKISEIIINTHYLPESVNCYVESSPYKDRIRLLHEESLLGTGGTLISLIPKLVGSDLMVAHADNLTLFDLNEFINAHHNRPDGCVATMMSFNSDNPTSCGILELDNKGVVVGFYEKVVNPPSRKANAAVFMFSKEILDILVNINNIIEISTDIVPQIIGKIVTFHNDIYHRNIGTPESLEAAEQEFPEIYRAFKRKGSEQ